MLHLQCHPSQPGTMAEAGWLLEVGTVQDSLQRAGLLDDVVLLVRLTTGEGPAHAPLFLTYMCDRHRSNTVADRQADPSCAT